MHKMTILLIWIGDNEPLNEFRNKCITQIMAMYPGAQFKVITKHKKFFGMDLIHPDNFDIGIDYEDYLSYSDYARLKWLSENPNTLYIDTDTWPIKPYLFGDKIGSAGFEAIWSGNQGHLIEKIYNEAEGRLLSNHGAKLDALGESLHQYFEHKPRWSRPYMNNT